MPSRFSGRREVAVGLGVYAVYLLVRRTVYDEAGRERAARNARRLVALERRLGLDLEPAVQRMLVDRKRTVGALNISYMSLNIALTVGSLMRLYLRRHPEFHRLRRAAALATLGAQPAFLLFPTAPPRTLDGFTDTIREQTGLDLDNGLVSLLYDPIAAMPSMHCAFAVVTAAAVGETAQRGVVRAAARAYPPAVAATVLATANHYVLDTVAGLTLGLASLRLSRRVGAARRPW